MNRMHSAALATVLILAAAPVEGQAQAARRTATVPPSAQPPAPRRTATLPAEPQRQSPPPHHHVPMHVRDGHVMGRFGGHDLVIPPCTAYGIAYRGDLGPAPQMGTNAPPPNANGLPPAPGLSPAPGMSPTPGASARPGVSPPVSGGRTVGRSSLEPLHGGWRTVGPAYVEGVCYIQDAHGSLHLIYL